MKAKDLFTIILKVFGIYIIKDVLLTIPPILENVHQLVKVSEDLRMVVFSLLLSLLSFSLHLGIVYLLLFKNEWLISKLRLTANLSDEPLVVNLHRSSVYSIAIVVTGILILVFAVPELVSSLYGWYTYIEARNRWMLNVEFDYSHLISTLAEVIIGILLLAYQRNLVNFIEYRRRL